MEAEHDIHTAWVALGGPEDKSGYVATSDIQAAVQRFRMQIDFERLLQNYYRSKNVHLFSLQDVSYQVFKELMLSSSGVVE